jgi:hypothetical protein
MAAPPAWIFWPSANEPPGGAVVAPTFPEGPDPSFREEPGLSLGERMRLRYYNL